MKSKSLILGALGALMVVALVLAMRRAEPTHSQAGAPSTAGASAPASAAAIEPEAGQAMRVPHFHEQLEDALPLPQILPASNFRIPVVARAYRIAARIPEVLAQQPCYCWCDKIGHGSLVDCFATDHGAG